MRTDSKILNFVRTSCGAIVLSALTATPLVAQNSTLSPYSHYGVGLLTPKEDACAAGLGHAGVALAPNEWVNISNPAALCNLDSLTFYFNFQVKGFHSNQSTSFSTNSLNSANIDGITMGFRAKKWLGIAIGYAPYSSVGYNMTEYEYVVGTDIRYEKNYKGSGGMQQAFVTASVSPWKHIVLGGNFSMLWGSITKSETAKFSDVLEGEDITNSLKYTMNNIYWELGIQFDFDLGQNNFRFGAAYSPKKEFYSSYDQNVSNSVSSELMHDDITPLLEDFHVPNNYVVGFAYTRRRFLATIDYRLAEWSKISTSKFHEKVTYRNSYTIGGGMQYSAGNRIDPFWKRLRYRVGGYYTQNYLDLSGINLQEYGADLGFSIPIGRSANYINFSIERAVRGTRYASMVREKFTTLKLAFNVHETWFVKSKFD